MTDSGFVEREVPASGAFHFFFVKKVTLSDAGTFCTAVVRAVPSRTNPGEFRFETTLIMDSILVTQTLQPGIFTGSAREYVEKEVSLYGTLFTMEDTFHRNSHLTQEPRERQNE